MVCPHLHEEQLRVRVYFPLETFGYPKYSIKAFWRSTWWYERKGSWKSREFTGGTLQLNRLARWKATAHNITIWQFLDTEGESLLHSGLKKKGVFIAIT